MDIEKQVISIDIALQFEALDFVEKSAWYWVDTRKSWKSYNCADGETFIPFDYHGGSSEIELIFGYDEALKAIGGYNKSKPIAAYSSAELGEILPSTRMFKHSCVTGRKKSGSFFCNFTEDSLKLPTKSHYKESTTEANVRGEMMIYLFKEGIVKFERSLENVRKS